MINNPLLHDFTLPPFSQIKPEHVLPALETVLTMCRETVKKIVNFTGPFTWENLCQPLAEAENKLDKMWSPISHLNAVKNCNALREVYKQSLPLLTKYYTWVSQHDGLFHAYQQLKESPLFTNLTLPQQKAVNNVLRDFKLSGVTLTAEKKQRYEEIVLRLSQLSDNFSNNVLDATMGWHKVVTDVAQLKGLPESAIAAAKILAQKKEISGWVFTLDIPSYHPVITYADDASLREEMFRAYTTRASEIATTSQPAWDNSAIMAEIVALRHELANLLDFNNYAETALVTKMAAKPSRVKEFLADLLERVKPYAKREWLQLQSFAQQQYGVTTLSPWDISYYAEKQKQRCFAIDDEQLRPYFPLEQVINGLFEIANRVFGLIITESTNVDTWHTDVRFYEVCSATGKFYGSFYLDLFAREHKSGGAWMGECVNTLRFANGYQQKPVAYLICNFNGPVGDQPALFTHNEVTTLFHELGHVLHHILTEIDTPYVSGIDGVPWDAVELPSQLLENWCWQPEALALLSSHYDTGEALPAALLHNLLAAKNYHAGSFLLRQLELCLFDFRLHDEFDPQQGANILQLWQSIKDKNRLFPTPSWNRTPHTFSHIFAGSYAVGYYSYLWAQVLSADAFSLFMQEGIFNSDIGHAFVKHILSRGGSEAPDILFKRFRGREPQIDAMLHEYGLTTAENQ